MILPKLFDPHYSKDINKATQAYFFYNFIFRVPIWVTFLTLSKGMSLQQIGIMLSLRYIASIILELPSGMFADLFGRKVTVLLGYVLTLITSLMFLWFDTFPQFVFLYILLGVYSALISGAEEALIYDTLKENKREDKFHEVSLWRGQLIQYGLIIGTLTGGFLYTFWAPLPFLAEAFAVAISLYFFVQVREPTIDSEHFSLKSYLDKLQDGVKDITKSRYILSLSLFYALVGAITFCFQIYFNQALLVSLGYSTIAMSLIFGGMRIFNISFLTKFMKQSKWFTFRNSILLFPLLMIIAYLPGIAMTKYVALIFILVSMLVSTSRGIILNKYLNDEVTSKNRATSISLVNLILSLVFSAVSFSSSIMTNIQLIFTFYGLISLIVILPLGLLVIKNKD